MLLDTIDSPADLRALDDAQLDQLCATGEIVWIGAGLDRVAVYFREDAGALGAVGGAPPPEGEVHDAIRAALSRSAEFWSDLVAATDHRPVIADVVGWGR